MSKITTERFTYNAHWLIQILPAFTVRFDAIGQEDPRVSERIAEIWYAVEFIKKASKVWFNENEASAINSNMRAFEEGVRLTISRSRNATVEESELVLQQLTDVVKSMMELVQFTYPASAK